MLTTPDPYLPILEAFAAKYQITRLSVERRAQEVSPEPCPPATHPLDIVVFTLKKKHQEITVELQEPADVPAPDFSVAQLLELLADTAYAVTIVGTTLHDYCGEYDEPTFDPTGKTKRLYQEKQQEARQFRRFLGKAAFDELMQLHAQRGDFSLQVEEPEEGPARCISSATHE